MSKRKGMEIESSIRKKPTLKSLADAFKSPSTRKRKLSPSRPSPPLILIENDDLISSSSEERFLKRMAENSRKRKSMEQSTLRKTIIRGPKNPNHVVNTSQLTVQKTKSDDDSVESVILLKHMTLHPVNRDENVIQVEEVKKVITYPPVQDTASTASSSYDTNETVYIIRPKGVQVSPSSLLTRSTVRSDRTETIGNSPSSSSTISSQSSKRSLKRSRSKSTSSKRNRNYKKKADKERIIVMERK